MMLPWGFPLLLYLYRRVGCRHWDTLTHKNRTQSSSSLLILSFSGHTVANPLDLSLDVNHRYYITRALCSRAVI